MLEELETLQLLQDRGSPEAKVSSQTLTRQTQSLKLEQQANMCGQSANARQGSVPADVELKNVCCDLPDPPDITFPAMQLQRITRKMPFLSYSLSHRVTVSTGRDDNGDFNEEAKRYLRSVQHIDLNAGSYAQEFVQQNKGSQEEAVDLGEGAQLTKPAAMHEENTGKSAS